MKEYLRRLTKTLAFRILMPTFAMALLAGTGLYVFILSSVSGFADEHIKETFQTCPLIYTIYAIKT